MESRNPSHSCIIDVLSKLFESDPLLAAQCRKSSVDQLAHRGVLNRIFDEFPCMLPDENIKKLADEFKTILLQVRYVKTDDAYQLNAAAMKPISDWQKKIIDTACSELLDDTHHIRVDLKRLLRWDEKRLSQRKVCDIVSAYTGAINQAVTVELVDTVIKNQAAYAAICNYVNKNFGGWVIDVMRSKACLFDNKAVSKYPDTSSFTILRMPVTKKSVAIAGGVGVGVGVIALCAKVAFDIYNKSNKSPRLASQSSSRKNRPR